MMDYTGIPAGLLSLTAALSKLVTEIWQRGNREKAERFATYCDRIAIVLDDTIAQLRRGHRPHGNCAELDRYMHDAMDILKSCTGENQLSQISEDLSHAYRVEYLDMAFSDPVTREAGYVAVETAAGRFRALATTLRAHGSVPDR